MSFADLGLGPEILKAVEEAGYHTPTPIQEQAIPVVLMGRDVLGVAQTGTGKTAGFTLPMIEILAGSRAKARMPRSLILAPTRELASQVADNFEKYGKYHKLTMALLIGGESFADQEKLLDRGVDVLIATPGRLMDLFDRGRILLNDVKVLVIDEADRMLDMGFIPDVERIVSLLPKIRQTLFFSATMAPEIRRLADAFLINPKEVSVAPQASTATTVSQFLVVCDELDKREALRHLIRLEDVNNALIFCNRKRDVDILYRSLTKHGFDVVQLHGDMPQAARTETLERFRRGEVRLMVCSDVAARGLDISDLSHVFNFDVPHHAEDYVHRIGRTGRAGKEGRAFTIASPEDGKFIAAIVKLIGKDIPRMAIDGLPDLPLEMDDRRRGRDRDRRSGRDSRRGHEGRSGRDERRGGRSAERRNAPRETIAEPAESAETPRPVEARPERRPENVRIEGGRPEGGRQDARHDHRQDHRNARPEGRRDRDRGERNDRGDRRRDRRHNEYHGIGEMTHGDEVIGFGAHVPDFMLRAVVLPPAEKPAPAAMESETGGQPPAETAAPPAEAKRTRMRSRKRPAAEAAAEVPPAEDAAAPVEPVAAEETIPAAKRPRRTAKAASPADAPEAPAKAPRRRSRKAAAAEAATDAVESAEAAPSAEVPAENPAKPKRKRPAKAETADAAADVKKDDGEKTVKSAKGAAKKAPAKTAKRRSPAAEAVTEGTAETGEPPAKKPRSRKAKASEKAEGAAPVGVASED